MCSVNAIAGHFLEFDWNVGKYFTGQDIRENSILPSGAGPYPLSELQALRAGSRPKSPMGWKRMVDFGMQPENIRAVRLGIASHILFDLAYSYLVARKNKISDFFPLNDTKEGQRVIGGNPIVFELDKELIKSLPIIDRIRYAAPERVPQDVQRASAEIGFYITRTPVMMDGRIELLQYYRQQSICNNDHRYGSLSERATEFWSKPTVGARVSNGILSMKSG